jgi:glycosyltransferase involved in cell wall biosynthesis
MVRELGLGGTERQLAETALSLDRTRFEPHVGCFRLGGFRERELRQAGIPLVEFPVRSLISPSALAGACQMGRYLSDRGIRLVHTFDVPADLFGVPVARLFRTPVVLSSQRAHRTLTPGVTRHLLRLTDRMVDGIVVNCQSVARELASHDGVPQSLLHLAYNGIDTGIFCPQGAAAELPWSDAASVIGVVCALRPEKGLHLLLEAFARVRAAHPGARLLIVGSGPMLLELEGRAASLNLGDSCRFQSAVRNVAEWLRVMDIFVLPSLSEALSNSLMEAMACGCCAIASGAGGNPELVRDGETGLQFPVGDALSLATCLQRVLDDAEERRRLGENAARLMRDHFSRETAAQAMGAIYTKYLEQAG